MAKIFGYARASSVDQSTEIQVAALEVAGSVAVFSEKKSGTTTEGREELRRVLSILGTGDVLLVTRVDRLARSIGDLAAVVAEVQAKGASLRAVEQPIDTNSAAGRAFLQMLGVFAEFETSIRKERQLEGIAKAKAEGRYKGRPVSIDGDEVRRLKAGGLGASAIAKRLGVGRASIYRHLQSEEA
jgi:DNA invertase Pin-like site-specific DNA recombinase